MVTGMRTALAACLLLAACTSSGGTSAGPSGYTCTPWDHRDCPSGAAPGTSASTSAHTSTPSAVSSAAVLRTVYLEQMRTYLPGESDARLIAFGHGVCRELDDGVTWTGIVTGLVDGGTAARTAGEIVATAVVVYCPAHQADLPG